MSNYNTDISAHAWAQPNTDLEKPYFAITVEWTWPTGDYWSKFQIVRSIRSPATRVEEGTCLLQTEGVALEKWSSFAPVEEDNRLDLLSVMEDVPPPPKPNPILVDPQPPPGEWVYYTLFVLDNNRVWVSAGHACEIGPEDYGWGLRLPELLPGVSVSSQHGVVDPADQDHDLVQFLQAPGTFMDIAATMAEASQYFWNPRVVPPQMLPALGNSWGYQYSEAVGIGRNRDILAALRSPSQGSLASIREVVMGAMGTNNVSVEISNNLMLDVNDSSFESGDLDDTHWYPKTGLEVRDYTVWTNPIPILPLNSLKTHFLHVANDTAGDSTYWCGRPRIDPESEEDFETPSKSGIPVSQWTKFRMGCYAFDEVGSGSTVLSLGMDFYDNNEANPKLLGSVTVLDEVALNNLWKWYSLPDGATVPITGLTSEIQRNDILTDAGPWISGPAPNYTSPQSTRPEYWDTSTFQYLRVRWNTAPTSNTAKAFWGVSSDDVLVTPLVADGQYTITMDVLCFGPTTGFRPAVSDGIDTIATSADYYTGGEEGEETIHVEFTWSPLTDDPVWFGIEAQRPATGWTTASEHLIQNFQIRETSDEYAYGVPWFTVSDACSIDLIVVDDG